MSDKKELQQSTAIVRVQHDLPVQSVPDLITIGDMIARSGMYGINNPASGFIVAATCHQEGITLFDYYRTYHTIEGKPGMKYDAMLARFRAMGGKHQVIERSFDRAEIKLTIGTESYTESLTFDEAKKEPYTYQKDGKTLKKNWATPRARRQMLWARVVSEAVRTLRPEINAGVYTPEEAEDFVDYIDITPEPSEPVRSVSPVASQIIEAIAIDQGSVETIQGDAAEPMDAAIPDFPGDDAITQPTETDYSTCPVPGKMFGKKWVEFGIDKLGSILNAQTKHAAMMPGHYDAIGRAANELNGGKKRQ